MIERLTANGEIRCAYSPLRGIIYCQDRTVDARIITEELRAASFTPSKGFVIPSRFMLELTQLK